MQKILTVVLALAFAAAGLAVPASADVGGGVPGGVTGVSVERFKDAGLKVTWTGVSAGGGDPGGYVVRVKPNGCEGRDKVKRPGAGKRAAKFKKLPACGSYTVSVRAANSAGKGEKRWFMWVDPAEKCVWTSTVERVYKYRIATKWRFSHDWVLHECTDNTREVIPLVPTESVTEEWVRAGSGWRLADGDDADDFLKATLKVRLEAVTLAHGTAKPDLLVCDATAGGRGCVLVCSPGAHQWEPVLNDWFTCDKPDG